MFVSHSGDFTQYFADQRVLIVRTCRFEYHQIVYISLPQVLPASLVFCLPIIYITYSGVQLTVDQK